jgi:PAS domain S-box-containing protein
VCGEVGSASGAAVWNIPAPPAGNVVSEPNVNNTDWVSRARATAVWLDGSVVWHDWLVAQRDYAHFLDGFALVLVVAAADALAHADRRVLPLRWLQAFALSLAVARWLRLLALGGGDAATVDAMAPLLVALGWVCLAVASFRLASARRAGSRPWVVVVLPAALGVVAAAAPEETSRRAALGALCLVAGIPAAALLGQAGSAALALSASVSGLGLACLALADAGCVWLGHRPLADFTLCLLRAGAAASFAGGLWLASLAARRARFPVSTAQAFSTRSVWVAAAVAGVLVVGWVRVDALGRATDHRERAELLDDTRAAAAVLQVADVARLVAGKPDPHSADYQRLAADLARVRAATERCRFAYVLALRNGRAEFVADSESPESKDHSPPGQVYDEASPELLGIFARPVALVEGPLPDQWGVWVSGLVPVTDPRSGATIAVFGQDIDARDWASMIARERGGAILHTLLLSLLLSGLLSAHLRGEEAADRRRALEAMVDRGPVVLFLWRIEPDGWPVELVSGNVEEVLGYRADDLLSGRVQWPAITHPDDLARLEAEVGGFLEAGVHEWSQEYRLVGRDGSVHWVRDWNRVVEQVSGEPAHIQGLLVDVTAERLAEEGLRRRDAILEAVAHTAAQLLQPGAWESSLDASLAALGQAAEADRAYLIELHADADGHPQASLRQEWARAGVGLTMHRPETQEVDAVGLGLGPYLERLGAGEVVWTLTRDLPAAAQAYYATMDVTSVLVAPVLVGEACWGLIGLDACGADREWTSAEVGAMQAAGAIVGSALARRRIEAALSASEERLRTLYESMVEVVAVHEVVYDEAGRPVDYRIVDCNAAYSRVTGISRRRAVGALASDVYGTGEPPYLEEFTGVARTGMPYVFETYFPPMDTHFAISVVPAGPGGFATISMDISERRRTELALQRSEELFRGLVTCSPDIIFTVDREGRIDYISRAPAGLTAAEAQGRPAVDFVAPEHQAMVAATIARVFATGESASYETRARGAHDALRWYSTRLARVETGGEPDRVVLVTTDITALKEAEAEHLALERQILHVQKLESLGVLAGGIAHDFNNLLTSVLGYADLASEELPVSAPARAHLGQIGAAARRAADLCRQMLAYSGKGRFVVRPLDMSEVVEEMAHMLEVSISKKVALRFELARGLPAVQADASQLRQVAMNLILNASEAIGEISGVVSVRTGVVSCDADYLASTWVTDELAEGQYVFLEVTDTGCGMDAETRERIFDPFYTTKFTGRGLGLAAVLGIVRGHQGAIKVYSEPGRGSSFKVLLPAVEAAAQPVSHHVEAAEVWHGSGLILLVDDEESVRGVGRSMLERLGFAVVTAGDGQEAVSVYRARADEIACVVLDLTMPRMDGEEAFRELRQVRPDVRVILSSGYNEQEVTQRFAGKGLAGFLEKPYRLETLRAQLRRVLDQGARPGG